jgi:hypothetical protein
MAKEQENRIQKSVVRSQKKRSRPQQALPLMCRLIIAHIFGWTQEAEVGDMALSLGERVASGASQVRGCLAM